jgi:hypothetical protein
MSELVPVASGPMPLRPLPPAEARALPRDVRLQLAHAFQHWLLRGRS